MMNEVLDRFFEKWTNETLAWYADRKAEVDSYKTDYDWFLEKGEGFSKADVELLRNHPLHETKGYATSIETIVLRDMAQKKAKLLAKVAGKVGEITDANLCIGQDGTPNGWVKGTKGSVTIETILAGGWNIQCLHYRVLVK